MTAALCGVVLLSPARAFGAEVAPEAVPSTAPSLPVIGTTRTRALCTALRENLAPAVLAIVHNDDLIASSEAQYGAMALSGPRQDLELNAMAKNVQAIVQNLSVARTRLDAAVRSSAQPGTDDERSLAAANMLLEQIVVEQTQELDTINGVLETIHLQKMMGGIPHTPRWFARTRGFFADVAAAIAEQAVPISRAESQLTPNLIGISSRCGAAKP